MEQIFKTGEVIGDLIRRELETCQEKETKTLFSHHAQDSSELVEQLRNELLSTDDADKIRMTPKSTIIDGYEIKQAENYHVSIVRLSDGVTVLHANCDKEQDAQKILDIYKRNTNE